MKVVMRNNFPVVEGLPEGMTIIFHGLFLDKHHVVFGDVEKFPVGFKVAHGATDEDMIIYDVTEGKRTNYNQNNCTSWKCDIICGLHASQIFWDGYYKTEAGLNGPNGSRYGTFSHVYISL